MVSNPSVLTLENQPAVIDFNRTQYLTPGRQNATILPVTVGTSFQVVPRVITSRGGHPTALFLAGEQLGKQSPLLPRHNTGDGRLTFFAYFTPAWVLSGFAGNLRHIDS